MLVEFLVDRDLAAALPAPLVILVVLVALAVLCAVRPVRSSLILFLLVGGVGAVLFQVLLIEAYPATLEEGLFIANRPAVALVLAGVTATF